MMPQIFIFTAGDRAARQHLADSIQNPIPDETVFANFAEADHEELEKIREEGNGFHAWGALPGPGNRRTWEAMDRGDRVLCVYDNTYRYAARVLAKYDNPDLARSVWGEGEDGKTWEYMYFLTEPREINRHVSELAGKLNASYFGFTKISDDKLDAIAAEYGSVEEFVDRAIERTPWFEPLDHPPGLEAELQLILESSNRKEQDLLAAIFRRAILLHQRHKTEGFLGAQPKNSQRFSITIGNVYACAVARNARETLYLLVDDDTTLRQTYEVGDAPFSKNELMWIHGRLDRDSLQSLLEDEAVWNAYGRMLPKVTNFPLARSNHNNRGKLSVISGKRYEPESGLRPNYWWVNQGATYRQERDGGYLWAPKEGKGARVLSHHANLLRVRPGDVILHYAKGALRAASVVLESAEEATRPSELPAEPWQAEGHLVRAEYHKFCVPIPLEDIAPELRVSEGGPFTQHGSVRQGYLFPLSLRFIKRLTEGSPERWPEFVPPVEQKQVWLFQANPKQWDLEQNLRTAHLGQEEDWTVTRYREDMRPGDTVILWQGGSDAGVYAAGELVSEPFERDLPPWRPATNNGPATEWAISFCYTQILTEPIRKGVLLEHPVLSGMQVLRAPQGTNFKVTEEEWEALRALFEDAQPVEDYTEPDLDEILSSVVGQGIKITTRTLRRYHLGLKSRGFVILSGVSGGGKTWLTEAYAQAVGAEYLVVPVAPNWTTNEDLLGYFNPLDNWYYDTQFSRFLRRAAWEYERAQSTGRRPRPYHLILDEMNLARVEYYFAKFLSTMEVRARHGTARIELGPEDEVLLPPNLRFAGTVNVDETTHLFADKVYDRPQLLELEVPREALLEHLGQAPYRDALIEIWDAAHHVAPFAFRVLDEIAAYVAEAKGLGVAWEEALDEQFLQKVLPKMKGADPRVGDVLQELESLTSRRFPLSNAKVTEMLDEFRRHGFASYF